MTAEAVAGQAVPRVLDAPVAFVQSGDGRVWSSAAGSYAIDVLPDRIRVRQAALHFEILFEGSRSDARIAPAGGLAVPIHSFTGGPSLRHSTAAGRPAVKVEGLYDGIDLIVRLSAGRFKTDYVVAPGADPSRIRVRYRGAESLGVSSGGELVVALPGGEWRERRPVAWLDGGEEVPVEFRLNADGSAGFAPGSYDRSRQLIIDPTLVMSTLFGGQGTSQANAVKVDGIGDVYVAGYTDAANFPNVSPVRSRSAGVEAWVVKVRPSENRILWATCLGGLGDDRALALALDPAGGVYVAGQTTSPDFPVASPAQAHLSGGRDAFLVKLTGAGDQIVFATFYGGTSVEAGVALAANSGGVWMAGETMSPDLPVSGAAQAQLKGVQDGFLARFQSTGAMVSSTYFGGSGEEMVRALAVDSSWRPIVAGSTESSDLGLPPGVIRRTPAGGRDAFVLRFNASASALDTGTLLGGASGSLATPETATALAVDSSGGTIVAGFTPSGDFPVVSPWQSAKAGDTDAFLARIAADFTSLTWSTFIGGLNRDTIDGVAINGSGLIYTAGKTMSANFPTVSPIQTSSGGNLDAFLMRFPAGGGAPDFASFLGGASGDGAMAIDVSEARMAWVAGVAGGLDFPQVTPVSVVAETGVHAFLAGVSFTAAAAPSVVSLTPASGAGQSQVFTLRISDASGGGYVASVHLLINTGFSGQQACLISYDRSSNRVTLHPDPGGAWSAGEPGTPATLSNRQCELRLPGTNAVISGIYLDLSLDLAFNGSLSGTRRVYAKATNGSGLSSGWLQPGVWNLTGSANRAPSSMSALPNSGGGLRQVFILQFTDPDGGGDFEDAGFSAGHAPAAPRSCTLVFDRAANRILLASDDGESWTSASPGASAVIENSKCLVRLAGSTYSLSDTVWTVRADIEFHAAWTGTKSLFLRATDSVGNGNEWTAAGSFKVGGQAGAAPGLSQLLPVGGSGGGALFEVSYSDAEGSADIEAVTVLINSSHQAAGGCLIMANRRYGYYYLASDSGNSWSSAAAGQPITLQNSQCALKVASSAFVYSGLTLRVRLDLAFKGTFLGAKTIWSHSVDQSGRSSPPLGWSGAYTVTSAQASLDRPSGLCSGFSTMPVPNNELSRLRTNRNPILASRARMGLQTWARLSGAPNRTNFAINRSREPEAEQVRSRSTEPEAEQVRSRSTEPGAEQVRSHSREPEAEPARSHSRGLEGEQVRSRSTEPGAGLVRCRSMGLEEGRDQSVPPALRTQRKGRSQKAPTVLVGSA